MTASQTQTELTIFFDGHCPLCRIEMRHLRDRDKSGFLRLIDIQAEGFADQYPELDWQALNERLHAFDKKGRLYLGLDASYQAWKTLGRGWLYAPFRWPIIHRIADAGYLQFAKHRYRLSYWLTGQKRGPVDDFCADNQCASKRY